MDIKTTPEEEDDDDLECHKCEVCDFTKCTYQTDIDKTLGIFPYRENPDGSFGLDCRFPVEATQPQALEIIDPPNSPQPLPDPGSALLDLGQSSSHPEPLDRPASVKRPRGGQPGNHNAQKHGLYLHGRAIYNTNPIERAQLFDLREIVKQFKEYMEVNYKKGLKAETLAEVNETMRSLSLAAMALTRLMNTHDEKDPSYVDSNFNLRQKKPEQQIIEFYQKKLDSFQQFFTSSEET